MLLKLPFVVWAANVCTFDHQFVQLLCVHLLCTLFSTHLSAVLSVNYRLETSVSYLNFF